MVNTLKVREFLLMKEPLIVRGAPQEYICEVGSWDRLEDHLLKRKLNHVLVLHGDKSWEVAQPFFPELKEIKVTMMHYKNQCSYENAAYFESIVKKNQIDGIVAVGGGKALDLGKLVANNCLIPSICLPTLASTCAAYTPVSVVYNEKGEMVDLLFFCRSISLSLVDPQVILDSPKAYLVAGIGDTLAKWYESDGIISQLKDPSVEILVAHYAAKQCQENLLKYGVKAVADLEKNQLTDEFIKVVETNILLAGMVGGFGDKYGRTSGAHSIHDALTFVPGTHQHLHGNKVAYGILIQLAVEGKWQEIKRVISFYKEIDLPYSFKELGLLETDFDLVANLAVKDELFHLLAQEVTVETIKQGMIDIG